MSKNKITCWNITSVPEEEILRRRGKVINHFQKEKAEAMVFFSAKSIQYLTGAEFINTERPIVFILKIDGSTALLVPRLELEHAENVAKDIDQIVCYVEYPGEIHPMNYLVELLKKLKIDNCKIAADNDGYGAHFGYVGPSISSLCPQMQIVLMPRLIEKLKIIKSPFDQMVIRESARWANLAHTLLQEYSKAGLKEIEIVDKATSEATNVMLKTLGPKVVVGGDMKAKAVFRGQIGKNSYYPHAMANNATLNVGDILVTGASAPILGYRTELERVLFVGEPTKEQEKYYNHAIALQNLAFEVIRPGKKCSDVDKEVMKYYKENALAEYWRHHAGHALGFEIHEAPFFDINDHTIIEPGMVFSVEPGIYIKDLGGFRLSDTLLVTEDGIEMITYYPREIDKVICKAF